MPVSVGEMFAGFTILRVLGAGESHTHRGILQMPEIGIEVPVAEFYEGVEFSDAVTEAASAG